MSFLQPAPPVTYRPLGVSIIGYYLAIAGLLGIPFLLIPFEDFAVYDVWARMGLEPIMMRAIGVASGIISAAAGLAILKRQAWGRTLYLFATPLVVFASAFVYSQFRIAAVAGGFATYGIMAYFLTRPAVDGFFDGTVVHEPADRAELRRYRRAQGNGSDLARIFGVLASIGNGLLILVLATLMGVAAGVPGGGDAITTAILTFGTIAVAVTTAGLFFWGSGRWMGYMGWTLAISGVLLVLSAASLFLQMDPSVLDAVPDSSVDIEEALAIMGAMGRYMLGTGLVVALIGVPLLLLQWRADERGLVENQAL
ncbi:MAG: hypothetical protein ACI80V_001596 [Rhodothermales bacterium]|jgi:hypothetical protein